MRDRVEGALLVANLSVWVLSYVMLASVCGWCAVAITAATHLLTSGLYLATEKRKEDRSFRIVLSPMFNFEMRSRKEKH